MNVRTNTLAAVSLTALLTAPTFAAPAHGPGGGGHGPGGGNGPGRFGQVTGTLTAIGTGTLTVTSANGTATVVTIASGTDIVGIQTIASSAIALGDTLLVSGIPVTLQAASIVDDRRATSTTGTTTGTTSTGTTTSTGAAPVPGTLRVRGVVTALSPPTITVEGSLSLTLTTTSTTTFQGVSTLTLSQLATGETVSARVMTSGTTTTALEVDVTP